VGHVVLVWGRSRRAGGLACVSGGDDGVVVWLLVSVRVSWSQSCVLPWVGAGCGWMADGCDWRLRRVALPTCYALSRAGLWPDWFVSVSAADRVFRRVWVRSDSAVVGSLACLRVVTFLRGQRCLRGS